MGLVGAKSGLLRKKWSVVRSMCAAGVVVGVGVVDILRGFISLFWLLHSARCTFLAVGVSIDSGALHEDSRWMHITHIGIL